MYFFYCLRSDVYFIIYMAICTASLAVWNYKKTCHTCFLITRHWSRRKSCIQTWLKIVAMEEHLTGGLQLLHTLKSNMTMDRLPVSQQWCSPYIGVRRLDQRRIDNKLSRMYKITHNLIAIPISDFLIPRVRPSRHYHPLSNRLITATTDYYNFSFFTRAVFHWNNLPLETVVFSTLEQFKQAVCKLDHVSP